MKVHFDDVIRDFLYSLNVRFQARAARGASLWKPWFGGTPPCIVFSQGAQTHQPLSFDYLIRSREQ